jgi:hypothetical protein
MKQFPIDSTPEGGYISGEDSTCWITCECGYGLQNTGYGLDYGGNPLFVSDSGITHCPKCGRGYKSEFVVWQYEPNEE